MNELLAGIVNLHLGTFIMFGISLILIYLAIAKDYEPMLLLPIGFGALLANIPFSSAIGHEGFLTLLYDYGIRTELFPVLIFVAVGAMIDFKPLLQNPFMLFFGAAAQFGIFACLFVAVIMGYDLKEAASIGIIGAADGPTSIYVANKFAERLLAPISVAAYSYMSLVPIIQPPVIKALTTRQERMIRMTYRQTEIPKLVEIAFPIVITLIAGVVAPISVALIGSLMFGNLIRACGVLERLSNAAQNELANLVTPHARHHHRLHHGRARFSPRRHADHHGHGADRLHLRHGRRGALRQVPQPFSQAQGQSDGRGRRHLGLSHVRAGHPAHGQGGGSDQLHPDAVHQRQCGGPARLHRRRGTAPRPGSPVHEIARVPL